MNCFRLNIYLTKLEINLLNILNNNKKNEQHMITTSSSNNPIVVQAINPLYVVYSYFKN